MPAPLLLQFDSLAAFQAESARWDDLWERSDVALPTARADLVAGWVEQFAPRSRFCAWAVEQNGRLTAGLALVGSRIKRLIPAGRLTRNPWSQNGDLLLDPAADTAAALALLAEGLRRAPWPLLWLDDVPLDSPRWRAFTEVVTVAGLPVHARSDYRVGAVDVPADWRELESRWTRNHRHKLRRVLNKLHRLGTVKLQRPAAIAARDVPELMRRAFEIEDRGWKSGASGSVLRQRGMFDYYCRIAGRLAAWGELDIGILNVAGEDIAFQCGSKAKGIGFASKVGYDERHAECSPGNALIYHLLRDGHAGHGPRTLDFAGPLCDWTARFATRSYPVGRLLVATSNALGRSLLHGYQRWWPTAQHGDSAPASS